MDTLLYIWHALVTNLKLFNTLYWICLLTFGTWSSITALESYSSIYDLTSMQCIMAAMVEMVESRALWKGVAVIVA